MVKANATFNAYLMNGVPNIQGIATPVTMTRHLVLEDDMKEYWGFYLLRGSSVTVSTCVRYTFFGFLDKESKKAFFFILQLQNAFCYYIMYTQHTKLL